LPYFRNLWYNDAMTIFDFFLLSCGLSLFLYGMQTSEKALRLSAGSSLKNIIEKITRNRLVALLIGLIMTLITQSSSATSVMLVGFASAGLVTLPQTLGIILGADIGTTVTVQLFAYKITKFAPLLISIGFFLVSFSKLKQRRNIGYMILGFGLVLFGMTIMADAVHPLRHSGIIKNLFNASVSPLILIVISAAFTGVIQSSAATIALIISIASTPDGSVAGSSLTINNAIPLLLGANIGTCATALLSSLRSENEGKRVAWAHTSFKIAGVLLFLPFMHMLASYAQWSAPHSIARQIANAHTVYNFAMALIFLPFLKTFSSVIAKLVPEKKSVSNEFSCVYIKDQYKSDPVLALEQAKREIIRMSSVINVMLLDMWAAITARDVKRISKTKKTDDLADFIQEQITPYLTDISQEEMHSSDSRMQMELLKVTAELELTGDLISKDIAKYGKKLVYEDLHFSQEGMSDLEIFFTTIKGHLNNAITSFISNDKELANEVIQDKLNINILEDKLRRNHFKRLKNGQIESIETTTIHLDLLEDLRRISSHAKKIAYAVLSANK